ncbi:type VI secretion system membrane subunit TssM [Phenylobacterium sp.]|uniref:type VI secretion system membrane subunit TssM n=1 Tax=Phenylobacterium sp. TaxID=1871053 RepID=UPI002869FA2E|nr:type VI secretion system membrane subunit TssM [Phenylobacterium sp.]
MNRVAAFFQGLGRIRIPRWTMVVLGAVMLAILVWFVGPLIGIAKWTPLASWWVRLIVIALMALGVGGYYALREVRRGRENARMMAELGPSTETAPSDDYSAEDIKAMNERAKEALEMMRTTRIGKNREFVYELPWYLIIGPPGAGKTTALHNAGLKFPVSQEAGASPLKGIGGTRNCEWWFTDQAVMIDTAGRYTLQDNHAVTDGKAWQGFLEILARYRPRQPVTGIIVALSVQDLMGGDEADIAAHGRAIRARLNEVAQKLGVRAPVYVVVTKMDLLAGFNEFFDDAGQPERDQVWGHTFDIEASRAGTTGAEYETGFSGLIGRLNDRLLSRVQGERDIQRRGLIFGFPQQIVGLKGPLASVLQIIGRETKYEPTPLIRGVYLTSAAQFGRPIDRLMGAISAKFGLDVVAQGAAAGAGRSYFLRDLLHSVIFQEGALTDRDPKTERRRRLMRNGAIVGGAAVLVLISTLWLGSYLRTASLLRQLETRSAHLQKTVAALPSGDVSDSDITQVLPALDEARALPFASTAPKALRPPAIGLGLGRRKAVQTQVDAAYANLLNQQMLPRLILTLEDDLRSSLQGGTTPGVDNRPAIYNLLRTYLMLGRAPGAPLEKSQISTWFAGEWANRYASAEDDPTRAALERHLDALLASRMTSPALDRDLIAQARERVRSLGAGERAYARMLSDPSLEDLTPFNIVDIPSVGTSGLFARRSGKSLTLGVPGLYRRQYFYSTIMPAIAKAASLSVNESWVTNEKPTPGPRLPDAGAIGRTKDEILVAYLKDFTRHWDDFIADITISGEHSAGERIQVATRPPSPVKLLINALAAETNLTPPRLTGKGSGSGGAAAAAVRVGAIFSSRIYRGMSQANAVGYAVNNGQGRAGPPGPLDEVIAHFKWLQDMNPAQGPSPLDPALAALAGVGDSAIAAQAAAGLGDPLLQRTKTSSAMEATARLDQTAATLPPMVQGMFTGFVRTSSAQLNKSVKQSIQGGYAAELLPQCQSIVRQGFPFSDSDHQATIDDLSRLLRPSGLMDQFVQDNLAGMVEMTSGGWSITPAGRVLGLQPASIREFERADRIRKRMFMPGDVRPNVRFLLEPVQIGGEASGVAISVDGVPASFDSVNRRPVEMKWPGPTPGVTLTFQKRNGAPATRTWSGDFALFRMVRTSRVIASSNKSLTFEVSEGGAQARFTMRFLNTSNPFNLSDLRSFSCPGRL